MNPGLSPTSKQPYRAPQAETHSQLWPVRALCYGLIGLLLESLFTGLRAALDGDRFAASSSSLWSVLVYGLGGLMLEGRSSRSRVAVRVAMNVLLIYAVEYTTGALLRALLGHCPWEYTRGWHVAGLVRLDYAPLWALVAFGFESWRASAFWWVSRSERRAS